MLVELSVKEQRYQAVLAVVQDGAGNAPERAVRDLEGRTAWERGRPCGDGAAESVGFPADEGGTCATSSGTGDLCHRSQRLCGYGHGVRLAMPAGTR